VNQHRVLKGMKLVVLQNGRRVSKLVHESQAAADKEKEAYVKKLEESQQKEAIPTVEVKELLLG
jgi:hypothetical protein